MYNDFRCLADVEAMPPKRYVEVFGPRLCAEISIEEAIRVPIPKREDFSWDKIVYRELRAFLYDFDKGEFISNSTFTVA